MSYQWLNDNSRRFLAAGYLEAGETAESRIKEIANHAQSLLEQMWKEQNFRLLDPHGPLKPPNSRENIPSEIENFSEKFQDYMSRGWFSLSSPVWSNFAKTRGLPVSCFGSYAYDSCQSIIYTNAEIATMTQKGGGTSVYVGALRERGAPISTGGNSEGPFSFLPLFESSANVLKQGATRRGSLAAYLDIDHPDIEEFLEIRQEGCELQDIFSGVCVSDEWMQSMVDGDADKRAIWGKVLRARSITGVPYILFSGNANANKPAWYTNDKIYASNLCNEIMLPSNGEESFVCVLSSINLLHYHEWKNTDAAQILLMFLDAVNEDFIRKAREIPYMDRPVRFAENHRALGMGVLGWHSFLQSENLAFNSFKAMGYTSKIFEHLKKETYKASNTMAGWFGEPEKLKGHRMRNATCMAIAPTKSSSFILGQVSQSIEPYHANYFIDDKAKIQTVFKNPYLRQILMDLGQDNDDIWDSIANHNGSVQHLEILTDAQKEVFKTFAEISQMDIVQQAAIRQKYIDQGQSLNLMIHPDCPVKEENALYVEGWKQGIKGFYYRRTFNAASQFSRELMTCTSCEG